MGLTLAVEDWRNGVFPAACGQDCIEPWLTNVSRMRDDHADIGIERLADFLIRQPSPASP